MNPENLDVPNERCLIGLIDCEIVEAKAHGLGRWIYAEFPFNYFGYFKDGLSCGKAVKITESGVIR